MSFYQPENPPQSVIDKVRQPMEYQRVVWHESDGTRYSRAASWDRVLREHDDIPQSHWRRMSPKVVSKGKFHVWAALEVCPYWKCEVCNPPEEDIPTPCETCNGEGYFKVRKGWEGPHGYDETVCRSCWGSGMAGHV